MSKVIRAIGDSNYQVGATRAGVAACVIDDTRFARDERQEIAGYCIDAASSIPAGSWRFVPARSIDDYAYVMPAFIGRDA